MTGPIDIPGGTKALIFDCDGTLVDTLPIYAKAWTHGFLPSEKVMKTEWYLQRAGHSEHRLMDLFDQDHDVTVDRAQVIALMREKFLTEIHQVKEFKTIADIARQFSGLCPIAVASGGSRQVVTACLDATHLTSLFSTIVTIEDVVRPKPEPDLFLEASRRLKVAPADCVVLEDTPEGLEAAKRAGMTAIDVRPHRN